MSIEGTSIYPVLEELGLHYRNNLNNRYLRKAFNHLTLERSDWEHLDDLLLSCDLIKLQSYRYTELYERIYSCARFVERCRQEISGNIRALAGASVLDSGRTADRVLVDMAVSNFHSNLSLFADMVNKLYLAAIEEDKKNHKEKSPVFLRMPELKEIGKMLVG